MKKLLKIYGLQSIEDYRNMVLDSYNNGQRKQAKKQFTAMPKSERVLFVKDMIYYYMPKPIDGSIFFFNALHNL